MLVNQGNVLFMEAISFVVLREDAKAKCLEQHGQALN